ncbi:DUF1648 domain-containing protein [Viridibacillus sp. YIM B01967]|uniref:DUF1648 domain-containing protein n=1 Tax=Viridibacillus soli TaxID=2798301 RepID=A0ABS1HD40_9BACL|nr:DUF1648 domain-containing protein [Viridibacillus soli]MBK3497362.1 DUF1648 domain-containing protein [Viridibacillus soli]
MNGFIFSLVMFGLIGLLQAFAPYWIKETIVFGVTVPDQKANHPVVKTSKRTYTLTILVILSITMLGYILWGTISSVNDEWLIFVGVVLQFILIGISMVLYFIMHNKITKLKKVEKWGAELKQVKVTDWSVRARDEMLPMSYFLLPVFVVVGLIIYTYVQYPLLPEKIPMHWGPNGQPDDFADKNRFSVIALPLILLTMQIMFVGIIELTRRSGIKISATRTEQSIRQQLGMRKYSSWFMFLMTMLITILFSFLQLMTIHSGLISEKVMLGMFLGFLFITIAGSIAFAVKLSSLGDARGNNYSASGITDIDEDQYWIGGLIYFNRNDPSVFVEKRFGVGWTINMARPIAHVCIFGPILLIILISIFA